MLKIDTILYVLTVAFEIEDSVTQWHSIINKVKRRGNYCQNRISSEENKNIDVLPHMKWIERPNFTQDMGLPKNVYDILLCDIFTGYFLFMSW